MIRFESWESHPMIGGRSDPGQADRALTRAEWQPVIYARPPERAALLALRPTWPLEQFRLQVLRNQPFEFVGSVLQPFLAFAGLEAVIAYSEYDDSLATPPQHDADAIVLWLDFDRYQRLSSAGLVQWLDGRLHQIRATTTAPILVSNWAAMTKEATLTNAGLDRIASGVPGVYVMDQAAIARNLGPEYRDERMARLAGTTISDLASLATARQLGLCWLPALLLPPIKAVAVDLDGTLYAGVLGEDGPANLRLTPEHVALQETLVELRQRGVFLAAVSRNEPDDVARLFRDRPDLPIRGGHFSAMAVSWAPKADGLHQVARELRIGLDAILYLDDNPGELAAVASAIPHIRTLHAADPALTRKALEAFPGLFRWIQTETDALRLRDLAASETRQQILDRGQDPIAYLASLQVEIEVAVDEPTHLQRLHELSQKTNQFNSGLRRLSAAGVAQYIREPDRHAVAISLRDRLSDSGIVGAIFLTLRGDRAVVDEVAISCRALGRGLERLMIFAGIQRALAGRQVSTITFAFTAGPRNGPVRTWLTELAGPVDDASEVTIRWRAAEVQREIASAAVQWKEWRP